MENKTKIWFDIVNVPQVHFQLGLRSGLNDSLYNFEYTIRDFFETEKLFKLKTDEEYILVGNKYGKKKVLKFLFMLERLIKVYNKKVDFDISISNGSEEAIITSWLRGKRSIAFGDNDTAPQWLYAPFVNYAFFPNAIDEKVLIKQGLKKEKLIFYEGFKEDIYLADYKPNKDFIKQLPFNNYVVLRPENLYANYVNKDVKISITEQILSKLSDNGINVLYLPKYEIDKSFAKGKKNVFIPEKPINGLDACYFSDCVITGAGTMAREAACLNVPAISFFAGKNLLAVDKKLISQNRMYHSRNVDELYNYFLSSKKNSPSTEGCLSVREEVISKLNEVIRELI